MTRTPFTVDDLTVSEHGILSRKVKGNPGALLADPSSQNAGDVLAGLCWLRDKRSDTGAKLEHYADRTLAELQRELGLVDDDDDQLRRTLAALEWIDQLGAAYGDGDRERHEQLVEDGPSARLDLADVDRLADDSPLARALVYVMTGVDVEHGDEGSETPAQRAQEAIDTVTDSNGADPTARPA